MLVVAVGAGWGAVGLVAQRAGGSYQRYHARKSTRYRHVMRRLTAAGIEVASSAQDVRVTFDR